MADLFDIEESSRINELVSLIKRYQTSYYNGEGEISDAEFDAFVAREGVFQPVLVFRSVVFVVITFSCVCRDLDKSGEFVCVLVMFLLWEGCCRCFCFSDSDETFEEASAVFVERCDGYEFFFRLHRSVSSDVIYNVVSLYAVEKG